MQIRRASPQSAFKGKNRWDRDFGDHLHIFDSYIKYAIKFAEAPVMGMSLHEYAPNTDAAKAYADIALEVMRCG